MVIWSSTDSFSVSLLCPAFMWYTIHSFDYIGHLRSGCFMINRMSSLLHPSILHYFPLAVLNRDKLDESHVLSSFFRCLRLDGLSGLLLTDAFYNYSTRVTPFMFVYFLQSQSKTRLRAFPKLRLFGVQCSVFIKKSFKRGTVVNQRQLSIHCILNI